MERHIHGLVSSRFADMDLSTKSPSLPRWHCRPHNTKVFELLEEGMGFPLKSEYDRANFMLEGIRRNIPPSALGLPFPEDTDDTTVRVVLVGDRWAQFGQALDADTYIAEERCLYSSVGGRWA